jgi:hypothetical protein
MADDVTAAGHDVAPHPRSVTETEYFIIQQVRHFKALHPAATLMGRRVARLLGRPWDDSLRQELDDLVRRQWLRYTEVGGYAANLGARSRLGACDDDAAAYADTGAFVL